MFMKKNGYVGGAALLLPTIRKLREHIEFEKFQCRVLKDDERTQKMRQKTESLKCRIFALRFNNSKSEKLTARGKNA